MTFPALPHMQRAARTAKRVLRSARGAFDLPSIIVGVVVVGILAAGVLAAVFAVIPFAQDNASKQDLAAVRTAEGVARAKDDRFMNAAGLDTAGYLEDLGKVAVGSDANGTCYVGMSLSGTGKTYFATDRITEPKVWASGTDTGCLTIAEQEALAASLGGTATAAPASSSPTVTGVAADWGNNTYGQLGDSSTIHSQAAVHVSTTGVLKDKKVSAVSVGEYYACGVADGAAYCWGNGVNGKIGNGFSGGTHSTPVAVDAAGVLAGKTVTDIDTGTSHTCAVASGAAYCWGYNASGELGDGSTVSTNKPVAVNTAGALAGKTVKSISVGMNHTCAVADGGAYCWGSNAFTKLGSGTGDAYSAAPVAVVSSGALAGKAVTEVAAGGASTCAVADGAAYCWGKNQSGQLGIGAAGTPSSVPVAVTTAGVMSGKTVGTLDVGSDHVCAVAGGAAYCWGYNGDGQLGNGSTISSAEPVAVNATGVLAGKTVTAASSAYNHSCVIASGAAYCWGNNLYGKLGNLTATNSTAPVAVSTSGILAGKTIVALSAGTQNTGLLYAG